MLVPIKLPPGLNKNGTETQQMGRFNAANLIRWHEGTIGPVGGWRRRYSGQTALVGACRALLAWKDNSGSRWLAAGTSSHLYAIAAGGVVTDITPAGYTAGQDNAVAATGFGRGVFGKGTFGSRRPEGGTINPATTWSLDYWGQNLVGCADSDGRLYEWGLDIGADALPIANAPVDCDGLLVTPERFLVALKTRAVIWSDQENNTLWAPAGTNQAGSYDLPTAGNIQQGLKLQSGFLVITSTDAWRATYQDPTYVYRFDRVGEGCGAISRKAGASTDTKAVWMGADGFYALDGGYVERIDCEISDYVFGSLNLAQASKVWTEHRSEFSEVWFHYPSASSNIVDRVAVYNYHEGHWTTHDLARSAGIDRGVFSNPIYADLAGLIYDGETGFHWGAFLPYAETAPYRLGNGDKLMQVQRIVPDTASLGALQMTLTARYYPTGPQTVWGPYKQTNPTDTLFQAGQIKARWDAVGTGDFRIGECRLDLIPGDDLLSVIEPAPTDPPPLREAVWDQFAWDQAIWA